MKRSSALPFFLIAVLFLVMVPQLSAQSSFDTLKARTVTVLDEVTLKPVPSASVQSWQPLNTFSPGEFYYVNTNSQGEFLLNHWWRDSDTFKIAHVNYVPQDLTVGQLRDQGYTVYLQHKKDPETILSLPSGFGTATNQSPANGFDLKHSFPAAPTLVDELQLSGEVFVQKENQSGGTPILWGFGGGRNLQMYNGFRLATGLSGTLNPNQLFARDIYSLSATEVINGEGSVLYGGNAMGGVINSRSKGWGQHFSKKLKASFSGYGGFTTANNSPLGHADVTLAASKVVSHTSVTVSNYGDLRGGKNYTEPYTNLGVRNWYVDGTGPQATPVQNGQPNKQRGSSLFRWNVEQVFHVKTGDMDHSVFLHFSEVSRVRNYEWLQLFQAPDSSDLIYSYSNGYQRALMAGYIGTWVINRKHLHVPALQISFQNNYRAEQTIFNGSTAGFISAWWNPAVNAKFTWRTFTDSGTEFIYGAEAITERFNGVGSRIPYEQFNPVAFSSIPAGMNRQREFSGFFHFERRIGAKYRGRDEKGNVPPWKVSAGVRGGRSLLSADFLPSMGLEFIPVNYSRGNNFLAANAKLMRAIGRGQMVYGNISSGYRTPQIGDLLLFTHSNQDTITLPSDSLKPEQSLTFQLGYKAELPKGISLSVAGFYTRLLNGLTMGNPGTAFSAMDTFATVQWVNRLQAAILGMQFRMNVRINKSFSVYATATVIRGQDISLDVPLSGIPPAYARMGVRYQRRKFQAEMFALYNSAKRTDRYGSMDQEGIRYVTVDGTPSYTTLHIHANWAVSRTITILLRADNLLDQQVRRFGSSISEAGISATAGVQCSF